MRYTDRRLRSTSNTSVEQGAKSGNSRARFRLAQLSSPLVDETIRSRRAQYTTRLPFGAAFRTTLVAFGMHRHAF